MSTLDERVAEALYRSGCIKFGTFKIKSGASSPYYIDMARLFSVPNELEQICEIAAAHIKQIVSLERIDKLASIELKGALILASIACKIHLPCIIVRKEKKTYGIMDRLQERMWQKTTMYYFSTTLSAKGCQNLKP